MPIHLLLKRAKTGADSQGIMHASLKPPRCRYGNLTRYRCGRIFTFSRSCLSASAYLKDLSSNLWWSWNSDAEFLFRRMDPTLWEEVAHNPKRLLESIDYKRLVVLADDEVFLDDSDRIFKAVQ